MQFMCCQTEHLSQQIENAPVSNLELQTQRVTPSGSSSEKAVAGRMMPGSSEVFMLLVFRRFEARREEAISGSGEMDLYLRETVSEI